MVIDESLSRHRIGRWIPERTPAGRPDLGAMPIIAANPWMVLVSCTGEAPLASHIPVILDRKGEPRPTLLGHLVRANPHSRLLRRRGRFSKPKLGTIGPELGTEQA